MAEPCVAVLPLVEPSVAVLPLVEPSVAVLSLVEPSVACLPLVEHNVAVLLLVEDYLLICLDSSALDLLAWSRDISSSLMSASEIRILKYVKVPVVF